MDSVSFDVQGSGKPLILIHGFPMNRKVWSEFVPPLLPRFKIYTPDLPGFGESRIPEAGFTIDSIATAMNRWVAEQGLLNSVVIGHSLGGYVMLAMAQQHPEYFSGIGLFHSKAIGDSEEKKQSRTKTIEFVKKNGAFAFTSNFIQPLFADPLHPAIAQVRTMATQAHEDAVTGYLQAMRDRPSRESWLFDFPRPVLWIAGIKDQGIPIDSIQKQVQKCQHPDLHVLESAAHMGMFEEPEKTWIAVQTFAERCY